MAPRPIFTGPGLVASVAATERVSHSGGVLVPADTGELLHAFEAEPVCGGWALQGVGHAVA